MRNMHNSLVRCALGFAIAICVIPTACLAAMLPAARDVVVAPGATENVEIPITNSGATEADFSLFLLSASFQPGIEQPQLEKLPSALVSWASLSESSVSLPSGASIPVVLSVHPPKNAVSQTRVFAVVVAEKRDGDIALIHGSATLVFVSVGEVSSDGACESFLQNTSDSAHLSLSNSGRGILYNSGEIVLRGMFGIRLGSAPSNPLFHRIPPEQTRTWQVSLPPIPWWAMGPLSYSVSDTQFRARSCADIHVGVRWLPLYGIGIVVFGALIMFIRRRAS